MKGKAQILGNSGGLARESACPSDVQIFVDAGRVSFTLFCPGWRGEEIYHACGCGYLNRHAVEGGNHETT